MSKHVTPSFFHTTHHKDMSSHQHNDDDDNVETSRASTPSPNTYLNSLNPLDYQNYEIPSFSQQTDETLFARQTTLLNQTQQMHEEMRGGFESFGKALKRVFSKKKKYGYMKNHKKTVKNGQARTRERKSVQKPEAKA
ncbi:hypothetical protein Tco_0017162 [Tanacetum coccineum]